MNNGLSQNDFELCEEDNDTEDKRHLSIKYNNGKYYLRDLGDGNGTFVKIESELVLRNGYIISFNDTHMAISFFMPKPGTTSNTQLKNERIQLKFIDGPNRDKSYDFDSTQTITIGRQNTCSIQFNDS